MWGVKRLAATIVGLCVVTFGQLMIGPQILLATAAAGSPPTSIPPVAVPIDTAPPSPPDAVPAESGGGALTPAVVGGGALVLIPTGCTAPTPVTMVFVGTLLDKDTRVARFRLEQVRAGSADGFLTSGLIDVRYDNDVRFLTKNKQYLVGASPLGESAVLSSRVVAQEPLYGGSAVIGVNDAAVECPRIDDPLRTLNVDGTPIESGVFNGLKGAKRDLLLAVLNPVLGAFGVVLILVLLRWLFSGLFVVVRRAAEGATAPTVRRDRRHHTSPRRP